VIDQPTSAPGYRHGDPVTVDGADSELKFVEQTDQWVEITPPDDSAVGFTVHQNQIERRPT
jgi:hypothetical protein